jgi:hypothetical protein
MYANIAGRGRVKSERYRTWLQAAGWDVARQHNQPKWTEPVYLNIVIGKLRPTADIDNRAKPIIDLLVRHGFIAGDTIAHVRGVNISLAEEAFDGVHIAIAPASRPARIAA